jgi:tetratricopeptide (TPR) repeat protein
MKTLYELLGASADDDAEALEKAFRKAVKAHHPDLHPDDPDSQARFREIVAAHAVLRDAKQRASYDFLLQLESERFLTLARQQFQSKSASQQVRSKWMLTTAVIAAVGTLIGGYGLATMVMTANMEINKNELAVKTGAAVENQTAIVLAAATENENPSAAIGATKANAVKGANTDELVEAVRAIRMEQASPADQGERRHDGPTASEKKSGAPPDIAKQQLALGPRPKNADAYKTRGIASYRSGDIPQAIASFNAAILLDPDDAQAYNIRGNAWDEMGDFKSALADYDEAIRIDPNNPAVFHDRAIMWQRQGEPKKALIDLDRTIRFSFSDARTYCDRGLVWYEMGHHDRAIADFNQAIKLDPSSAADCIQRGLILHHNSEFTLALGTVNHAIRVDPGIFDAVRGATFRP